MFKKLAQIRNNLSIGRRLEGLVVIVAVLIIVLGSFSVRSVSSINSKINETNELYLKSLVKLSGLIENIYSLLIESHIVDEKSLTENSVDNSLNIDLLNTYLIEYEQSIVDDAQKSLYDGFLLELQNYLSILKEVNSFELQGKYQAASEVKSIKEINSFKKLQSLIKSMLAYNTKGIQNSSKIINDLEQKSINSIYVISLSILFLSLLIVIFLIQDISSSLKELTNNLTILQKGEIPETNLAEATNELGQMAGLTNSLTKNLAELNRFAGEISRGNYSSEYEFAGKNDLLGKALVNLRNNLRISKEEDEIRKLEEERRNWTNKGHAIFGEILRQRSREVNFLTDDIIKNLVYYLNANQGGLFLINDTGDISKIELISAFAFDRKKFFERSINIGDGLIGTVALERNTIYLKQIPEDYIEIESGLGDAKPKCLLIVPLKFEEDILGIVEIASFKEFQDFEMKFVEEVAQSIASTLLTAKINARTQHLLDESRKQSDILAAQEIEARQNMEEMRATQELAQRREADLSGIISAVDNTLMKGEYELDGTLISVNNRHLQTMGYQLKEIKGKNIEMFIPEDELEHFRKVWANVVAGHPRQLEVRRRTKTGEVLWLINQYTPVTDVNGKISKVLYFAHDITRYKKSEEELIKKISEVRKSGSGVNDSEKDSSNLFKIIESDLIGLEIDKDGRVIYVNRSFENLFNTSLIEIKGKIFHEIFAPEDLHEDFRLFLNDIKSGIIKNKTNTYHLPDGKSIWLHEFYSVVADNEDNPPKIIVLAYDITLQKSLEQQNEKYLNESKNVSEILKNKEEEMKKSFEELMKDAKFKVPETEKKHEILRTLDQYFSKIEIDLQKNLLSANKNFTERYKYSERELINKPISRLIVPELKEKFKSELDLCIEEKLLQIATRFVTKDKEFIDVVLHFIPYYLKTSENPKLIIFIIENGSNRINENEKIKLTEEIEGKKKELMEINNKIEDLKKQVDEDSSAKIVDSEDNENRYSQWLKKLKNDLL